MSGSYVRAKWIGLLALPLLLAWGGCSDDAEADPPVVPTGGQTAPGGAGGAGGDTGGAGGETPQPPSEPVDLPVAHWMVARVVSSNSDPVMDALEDASFQLPPEGSYLGLDWETVVPGENCELIDANADLIYAAAVINVPEGHHAFVRPDTVSSVFTDNAARQPGDYYPSAA